MTEQFWRDVWQVLVEECGAQDTESMWLQFIHYMGRDDSHFGWEFRFMGELGFGGKFYREAFGRRPLRVSCYPEDATPARRQMIKRANERLAGMVVPV